MKLLAFDPAVQVRIRTSIRNMQSPCYVAVSACCFDTHCREIFLEDNILIGKITVGDYVNLSLMVTYGWVAYIYHNSTVYILWLSSIV